ncbi:hypothetical protein ACOSQ3_003239 [Xanthoceras sorbifolium]
MREPEVLDIESEDEHNYKSSLSYETDLAPPQYLMKNYARPFVGTPPTCILLDASSRNYELKMIHLNMLPSFHGLNDASMKKMEIQLGQPADHVKRSESGKFPSQPEQAQAITILRSGKVVDNKINSDITDDIVNDAGENFDASQSLMSDASYAFTIHASHPHRQSVFTFQFSHPTSYTSATPPVTTFSLSATTVLLPPPLLITSSHCRSSPPIATAVPLLPSLLLLVCSHSRCLPLLALPLRFFFSIFFFFVYYECWGLIVWIFWFWNYGCGFVCFRFL